jgi:TonB family protein
MIRFPWTLTCSSVAFCILYSVNWSPAFGSGILMAAADTHKPGQTVAPASTPKRIQDQFFDIGPYMVGVSSKIKKNWHAPPTVKSVVLRWQIAPDGTISDLHIDKSSGDPANDKAALDAVASSAPFDPIPKGMPSLPIEFGFGNAIRSGLHEVSASDQAASHSLYNEAVELINKKQFSIALDKLEFALDRDPKNTAIASALRYVGAYVSDDTPDGVTLLYRVLAIDPKQAGALEKLKFFVRAQGQDPGSAQDRLARGQSFLDKKEGEGALVEFTAANSIKANSAPSERLVECYRILAGHRMASKWQTVIKSRRDVEALCGLGRSYQLSGEFDKAEAFYKEALALDATSDMAKSLMAKLDDERTNGPKETPVASVLTASHQSGNSGSGDLVSRALLLNNEGITEMKAGNYSAAIEKFREALSVDATYMPARENLSSCFNNAALKLPVKDAVGYFHKALYVTPDSALVRKNLASSLKSMGNKPDSFEERIKLADDFANAGDFVSAVVELREGLSIKKDGTTENKLKDYLKKAPAVP